MRLGRQGSHGSGGGPRFCPHLGLPGAAGGELTPYRPVPSPSSLNRCTLRTQTRRLMCNVPPVQFLQLGYNQIGDAGVTGLADACASGSLAQLQVRSRLTASSPCLEAWHACSPGLTVLFDAPYVLCAAPCPQWQPDWRRRRNGSGWRLRQWRNGALAGELAPHCLDPMP